MAEISTIRPLLIQHGIAGIAPASTWTDYETDIDAQTGIQSFLVTPMGYSQIYDYELVFDAERSLALDKPVFFSNESNLLRFQIETNRSSPPTTFSVGFYNTFDQQLWETGATGNEASDDDTLVLSLTDESPEWVFNSDTSRFDLDFNLDMNLLVGSRPAKSLMYLTRDGRWRGRLALSFTVNVSAFFFFVRNPSAYNRGFLVQPRIDDHTGWSGFSAERGRPVRDMRSGLPAFAQDLVEDNFSPGIWTSGINMDPADPRDFQPVEFPPDESTKDDDVPV